MSDEDFVARLIAEADRLPRLEPQPHLVWAGLRRRRQTRIASGAAIGCVALAGGVFTALRTTGTTDPRVHPAESPSPAPSQWCVAPLECFDEPGAYGWTREFQVLVEPYVDAITAAGIVNPDFAVAKPSWDPPGVTVLWHGPLPAELDPIIAEAAAAGVQVTHVDIPYRVADLHDALHVLIGALTAEGLQVTTSTTSDGFTGIAIGGPELSTDPQAQARATELAAQLIGDIPVTFLPEPGDSVLY